jgi:uncharacterized protein
MPVTREHLILFTRYPEPGAAKTRLIPVLGPEGAAALQRRMSRHAFDCAQRLTTERGSSLEVRHEGGSTGRMRAWLGPRALFRPQGAGDLGRRMAESLSAAFAEGAERAVIIGSDIPGISPLHLARAFDALGRHDLVFGPTTDGGYYLIGVRAQSFRRDNSWLDERIPWGTAEVLRRSLAHAREAGLSWERLEGLADIDRPQDLSIAMRALSAGGSRPSLSVVIPTLNEEAELGATLAALPPVKEVEIIVSDGGSCDATVAIARARGAGVLKTRPPRAIQMNAGAAMASGRRLLFLHADTRLPRDPDTQVEAVLSRAGTRAGAFHLAIDAPHPGLRLIAWAANRRSRLLQMPYGDQALFMDSGLFWDIGGFAPLAIMDDYDLVRRLKKATRIGLAPGMALTSARRWQRRGILATWLCNQLMVAGFHLGVPSQRLARWYRLSCNQSKVFEPARR